MQLMHCIKNGQIMARNVSTGGLKVMAIRREDQSLWERRAPLGPHHVRKLVKEGVKVIVQPSNRRCYPMQVIFKNLFVAFVTRFLMTWQFIISFRHMPMLVQSSKRTLAKHLSFLEWNKCQLIVSNETKLSYFSHIP